MPRKLKEIIIIQDYPDFQEQAPSETVSVQLLNLTQSLKFQVSLKMLTGGEEDRTFEELNDFI